MDHKNTRELKLTDSSDDDDIVPGANGSTTRHENNQNNDSSADDDLHQVEAKLVNGGDSEEMNLMNLALQEENERLRQQLEIPTAMVHPAETSTSIKEASSESASSNDGAHCCCSKNQTTVCIVVVALLVLIGAGVGAFFATQSAGDDDGATVATTPPSPSNKNNTSSSSPPPATITLVPSPNTAPPTNEESLEPSFFLLFDAPTDADCLAVKSLNNTSYPIPGQDELSMDIFQVELETSSPLLVGVGTDDEDASLMMDTLVERLIQATQQNIVPVLVGCENDGDHNSDNNEDTRRKLLIRGHQQQQHHHQPHQRSLVNEYRYAIANAKVSGRVLSDPEVINNTISIGLELDLYLKSSNIRDFDIIPLLDDAFGGGNDDLVDRLGLGDYFDSIAVASIAVARPEVPETSCMGAEETCQFASGPIGSESCTGANRTCWNSQASIGDGSCNHGGCTGILGDVADGACNGAGACPVGEGRIVKIGTGSCNCDGCCACLTEPLAKFDAVFVPPRSCNSLAPAETAIDYRLENLTPRDPLPIYCCSA